MKQSKSRTVEEAIQILFDNGITAVITYKGQDVKTYTKR